jgi:hypothetical protein
MSPDEDGERRHFESARRGDADPDDVGPMEDVAVVPDGGVVQLEHLGEPVGFRGRSAMARAIRARVPPPRELASRN